MQMDNTQGSLREIPIMMRGNRGVGKTSLACAFTHTEKSPEIFHKTEGGRVEYMHVQSNVPSLNAVVGISGAPMTFARMANFRFINAQLQKSQACIIVAINSSEGFRSVRAHHSNSFRGNKSLKFLIIGVHNPTKEETVDSPATQAGAVPEIDELAREKGLTYVTINISLIKANDENELRKLSDCIIELAAAPQNNVPVVVVPEAPPAAAQDNVPVVVAPEAPLAAPAHSAEQGVADMDWEPIPAPASAAVDADTIKAKELGDGAVPAHSNSVFGAPDVLVANSVVA